MSDGRNQKIAVLLVLRKICCPLAVGDHIKNVGLAVVVADEGGHGRDSLLAGSHAVDEVVVAALELPVLGAFAGAVPVVCAVVLAELGDDNEGGSV